MARTKRDLEFAVIGGGISGLSLGIALYERGLNVTIYEQAPAFGEIGAGVSFHANAIASMKYCSEGIHKAFEKVASRNLWPEKQKVWFDYYDGFEKDVDPTRQDAAFTINVAYGQNGVHRARFLDELVKLFPSNKSRFGKRLDTYEVDHDGRYTMHFQDGTTATADAILACDGIKSKVRQLMFGPDHPCSTPSFSHKVAYRALVPMEEAVAGIGEEKAQNACMYMGPGSHVLTFPVNHGQTMNVVAFHTTDNTWKDTQKLVAPATREDAFRDFQDFGPAVHKIIQMARPELDVWAIFDLAMNPVPTMVRERVCLIGDAAHATSPHHGAGAGMCIEDAAVMTALLADDRVNTLDDVSRAFEVFNRERKDRGQWLVQQSRHIGDCYEWQAMNVGRDFAKIEEEINRGNSIIADVDVEELCRNARSRLNEVASL